MLNWRGNKKHLLKFIGDNLPNNLNDFSLYIEPFAGSLAVYNNFIYGKIPKAVANDLNVGLITFYTTVVEYKKEFIYRLAITGQYINSLSDDDLNDYYRKLQKNYNKRSNSSFFAEDADDLIESCIEFFVINKLSYRGRFTFVPTGNSGTIVTSVARSGNILHNLEAIDKFIDSLQDVTFFSDTYDNVIDSLLECPKETFIYLDPPYLNTNGEYFRTKSLRYKFDENDHVKLSKYLDKLDSLGVKFMLSNSVDTISLYKDRYTCVIDRVTNMAYKERQELIVTNYG
jgi:DNA adenine methylase